MYRLPWKFPPRRPMDEQGVRTVIALVFVAAIVAFYVWFTVTHLQRLP